MKRKKSQKRANISIEEARILTNNIFPGNFKSMYSSTRGVAVVGAKKFSYGRDPLSSMIPSSMFKTRPDAILREKLRSITIIIVGDISYSMFESSTDTDKIDIVMLMLGAGFNWARAGNKVGALLFDEDIRWFDISDSVSASEDAILELEQRMEDIVSYAKKSTHHATNIQPALAKLIDDLIEPALIFLVSDFVFPFNCENELGELADMCRVVPIIVNDKTDKISLPWWSYFVARDIESGELVCVSQIEKDETTIDYFEKNDIPIISVNTDTEFRGILFKIRKFFRNTGGF